MIFDGAREDMTETEREDHRIGSIIAAGLAVLAVVACAFSAWGQEAPIMPNADTTPGFTNPDVTQANIHSTICVSGWTKTIRPPASYTTALKIKQLAEGGYTDVNPSDYEEDHLVSLEIGGHPTDPRNLWPEIWDGDWGAHRKDRLENRLKTEVCSGRLPLIDAQDMIRRDWRAAYCRYYSGPPCPPQ
jgi:hypothetical protein